MRSLLFVPADDARKLDKAPKTGADVIILDLEDSVTPARKNHARNMAAEWLAQRKTGDRNAPKPPDAPKAPDAPKIPKVYVRINPLTSGLTAADLEHVMPARPDGILQPKSRSAADAVTLSAMIRGHEKALGIEPDHTGLVVLVTECAAALQAMAGYDAAGPRLKGLTWGAEDLSADIGTDTTRNDHGDYTGPYAMARSLTLVAATAANTMAIDTVFPDFRDETGFDRDCAEAVRDGFTAKLAIHPAQVPVINKAFTPDPSAIARAQEIVEGFAKSDAGVISLQGQMLDRPHLRTALALLARANITRDDQG